MVNTGQAMGRIPLPRPTAVAQGLGWAAASTPLYRCSPELPMLPTHCATLPVNMLMSGGPWVSKATPLFGMCWQCQLTSAAF